MHSFKDSTGRVWHAALTVGTLKKARDLAGVDLAAVSDGEVFRRLAADPALLCAALHAISRPAQGESEATLDAFCEAMDGDTLGPASDALVGEVVDFFPPPIRARLKSAVAAAKAAQQKRLEEMDATAPGPSAEPATSSASPSSSPASPESTPAT